jgi:nucleotide-binding universal stress UspA family protein
MDKNTSNFGKILVAVDGSEQSMRAVDVAISLAKKYDSLLTALYVIHIPFGESIYPRAVWHKEFIEDVNTETRAWFEDIGDRGKKSEVSIELTMKEAAESIPAQIIKYANERNFDLIVVGSKGKTGLEKLFLGSVAAGVLAYAPCPVLVVR